MTNGYQSGTLIIRRAATADPARAAAGRDSAEPWHVFLSSTVGDLEEYRGDVQDALFTHARVACFLSEDWVNSYEETAQRCRDELEMSRGYIGIFAYLYGSVPKGSEQSYTHMEFSWALKKWEGDTHPPIAVLMPKSPSDAEEDLKRRAAPLIQPGQERRHAELLSGFHRQVTDGGRTVTFFRSRQNLREHVITIGLQWRLGRPADVVTGALEVIETETRRVTDEEWGALGRGEHLTDFDKILSRVDSRPDAPAVAVLVHGGDDAGQRVFAQQLLTKKKLNVGRPARAGYGWPQSEQYDLRALTQWAGTSLGVLPRGKEAGPPEELADLIFEELQSQQVCFVLDRIHHLCGGVAAFYEGFWRPLYARLAQLRAELRGRNPRAEINRLVAVVVDYSDRSDMPREAAVEFTPRSAADACDYSRLVMLRALGDISKDDLLDWFDYMEIPDAPPGRRAELARIAVRGADGEDGKPLRVFDRLGREALWPRENVYE